ncbi:hypothetical protein ACCO45_009372 [Purpureocillium lilacinum]|uniref:Uncharacterized protein n=1 Tax=Purpureocillium lilacinum TaxID=33203 RepID=A0ACC4DJQ8_PURLI
MEPLIAQASSVSNDSHELVESGIDRPANSSNVKANDLEWSNHPRNPLNLPAGQKLILMSMVSLSAFVTPIPVSRTAGTSVVSPATAALQKEFDVGETAALLPLSLYVFALASGPVVGGPLSETVGRMPVYYVFFPLGALFTLGAGLTRNFGAFCFLRFAAGFCWAPSLTVAAGSISETFAPKARGLMMALFIFMPFLGPGFGPVLGAYAANRQGWPWTQWVLLFITVVCIILIALTPETFPPVIKKRVFKNRSESSSHPQRLERLWAFATISLFRPVHMLFTEPIITFICLYVAINFGVLFSFFAAVPYTFETVYAFNIEQTGLVFFSIVIGSFLGLVTIIICDVALYRRQAPHYPPGAIPPEFRLYPAMIGVLACL